MASPHKPANANPDRLAALPPEIGAKLRALRRRARLLTVARGLGVTLAVAALGAIALVAFDASFTLFSAAPRVLLLALAGLAVAATAYLQLWRPLRRKPDLVAIARAVEHSHPELEERLSSSVELLASDDPESHRGSEQMLARLLKDASIDASALRPAREFSLAKARRPLLAATAGCALVGGLFALWPESAGTLFARAFTPLAESGNVFSSKLDVTPGDIQVPEGDPLLIEAVLDATTATETTLRRRVANDGDAIERMTYVEPIATDDPTRFRLQFPAVTESFEYRVHSGRALSQFFKVEVLPRPRILDFQIAYTFPPHTGLPPRTETPPDSRIAAPAGTVARLTATIDAPVKSATLLLDSAPIWDNQQTLNADGNPQVTWEFALFDGTDASWSVQLEGANGVTNLAETFPLIAISDAPPTVTVTSPPTNDLRVSHGDVLPISYMATEDYGILEAQLLITAGGRELPTIGSPLPNKDAETETWTGEASLNLNTLAIGDAQQLELRVRIADNNPSSAGVAISEPITLRLDREAESLLEQMLAQQHGELQKNLWGAMEKLLEAQNLAKDAPGALIGEDTPPEAILQALEQAGALAGEAEALLQKAANGTAGTYFEDLASQISEVASEHIAPARTAAESVALSDRDVTRVHQARTAARDLEESIAELGTLMREARQQADQAMTTAALGDLEARKKEIADALATTDTPDEREAMEEEMSALDKLKQELLERGAKTLAEQLAEAGGLTDELAKKMLELAGNKEVLEGLQSLAEDLASREDLLKQFNDQLEEQQLDIAKDLADLATSKRVTPEMKQALEKAAELGRQSAEAIAANQVKDAERLAMEATAALPDSMPSSARARLKLERLAEAQRGLSEQMSSLSRGDLESALGGMEGGLADLAKLLAEDGDGLNELLQSLADPELAAAVRKATEQLANGSDADRAELEAAAQSLAEAASALADGARRAPGRDREAPMSPEQIESGRQELAKKFADAANAKITGTSSPGAWSRIGSGAGGGLDAVTNAQPPAEYRDMVRRYFEEIARRSAATGGGTP